MCKSHEASTETITGPPKQIFAVVFTVPQAIIHEVSWFGANGSTGIYSFQLDPTSLLPGNERSGQEKSDSTPSYSVS